MCRPLRSCSHRASLVAFVFPCCARVKSAPPRATCVCVCVCFLGALWAPGTGVGFLVAMPVKHAQGIHILLWGEAIFAGIIVVLCIIDHAFFPPLPPSVPSATASKHRAVDTIKDFGQLLSNGNFMVRPGQPPDCRSQPLLSALCPPPS
jgi:hypothetical protein